jgi:hypothetical protein
VPTVGAETVEAIAKPIPALVAAPVRVETAFLIESLSIVPAYDGVVLIASVKMIADSVEVKRADLLVDEKVLSIDSHFDCRCD